MKKFSLMLAVVALTLFTFANNARAVLFDFDGAPHFGGLPVGSPAGAVEDYMEQLYGSPVTIDGDNLLAGIVGGNGFGPLGQDEGKPFDHYIQAGPIWGAHWFSFTFEETPISSVSFDWGIKFNTFHAYADDVEIFSSPGWNFWAWGNSGTIDLLEINPAGVRTLRFSDSCVGEIEVDNLIVSSVSHSPEPATIALFGLGSLLLLGRSRRLDKK